MSRFFILLATVLLFALSLSCNDPVVEVSTPPGIVSVGASRISSWGVILGSSIQPNGLETTCHFESGATTQYGSNTPQKNIGSGTSAVAVAETLASLHPGTMYHWRIVTMNSGGTSTSADSVFATVPFDSLAPTARTDSASSVTNTTAWLFATVNPRSLPTTCYFEYGSTYGGIQSTTPIDIGSGGTDRPVSCSITSLSSTTTYQYRIIAVNPHGYAFGEYKSLTTTPDPLTVTQNQAFLFSNTKVELTGQIWADGSNLLFHIEYGTTENYGQKTSPKNVGTVTVSEVLENLAPGSVYHWRIVASNSGGITYGPDSTFFLPAAVKPFDLPLRIGSRWKYWFQMLSSPLRGYHTWEVTGTDGSGNWTFIDIRQDSNYASGSPIPWRNDTVSFVLKDLPDYYQIDFSEWQGPFYQCKRIPKWIDSSKDTVKYYGTPLSYGYTGYEGVAFANGVGLVEYFGKFPQMTALPVSLSLLEYLPPGIQKSP